jgi:hypothetical protein
MIPILREMVVRTSIQEWKESQCIQTAFSTSFVVNTQSNEEEPGRKGEGQRRSFSLE